MQVCACFPECPGYAPYEAIYNDMYEIFTGCSGSPPPIYTYATDTGHLQIIYHEYYDGILTPYLVTAPSLFVDPPLGHISYEYSCAEPHGFLFHSNSIGADSIVWNFGDGIAIDTGNVQSILHEYLNTGNYIVSLEMYNFTSGCVLTDNIVVYVRDIYAEFEDVTLSCANEVVVFNASASEDVFTPCYSGFDWDFGDYSPVYSSSSHTAYKVFEYGGIFNVELTVTDINGCKHKHTDTIHVYDISANVSVNPNIVCVPENVLFSDLSWADTTIVNWSFNPGNGNILSNVPSTQLYESNVGVEVPISLTVIDVLGCEDTWNDTLTLSVLDPYISALDYNICVGEYTQIGVSQGFNSILWYVEDTINYYGNSFNHQFNTPGLYDIIVTLKNSFGCEDSIILQDFINVHPLPEVFIISDPPEDTLCLPVQITFTDVSIVDVFGSRVWDFNNSATINPDVSVTWPYETPGTYEVSLTVESLYGCSNTATKVFDVQGPMADFVMLPPTICQGEEISLELIDTSNVYGWLWDFGDGIIDSTQSGQLSHTYLPDYYPYGGQTFVSLIYWSANCEVTVSQFIEFHPEVIADFTIIPNDSVVCLGNSLILNNTSINAIIFDWDMGDGSVYSNSQQVSHSYLTPGIYQIELIATDINNCEDVYFHDILVADINAEISASPQVVCDSGLINFTNNSYSDGIITEVLFEFGDGSVIDSFVTNHFYTTPPSGTNYQVQYSIENNFGCSSSYDFEIQYSSPDASFATSSYTICEEDIVNFNPTNQFVNYLWDFGDGNSSTDSNPSTSYNQYGNYVVSLSVVDTLGCVDTAFIDIPLTVYDMPEASFSYTPNQPGSCIPGAFSFVNTSTCIDQTTIIWTILPDTYTSDSVSILWPDVGVYNVNLIVTSAFGCINEAEQLFSIEGPTADLQIQEDIICINTNAQFTLANPVDVISWVWDFGDGTFDSTNVNYNQSHIYSSNIPANGMLYIDLIINSGNCTDTLSDSIFVANPIALFTLDNYSCINDLVSFDNLSTGSNSWLWNFGDGSTNSTIKNPIHQYNNEGIMNVTLISSYSGINSCSDTYTTSIQILNPLLGVIFDNNPICRGNSEAYEITLNQDVENWSLTFYDGGNVFTGTGPQSGSYTYPTDIDAINYGATVTVNYSSIDGNCPMTFELPITFYDVIADFISTDHPNLIICKGESITLQDNSTNANYLSWDFGDGTSGSLPEMTHVYNTPGTYPITLVINNVSYGCQDDETKDLIVRDDAIVNTPYARICEGDSYTMQISAQGGISSYFWSPEQLFSNPYEAHPVVNPTQTQTFTVEIIDNYGCPGSGSQTVFVVSNPPSINWDTTIIIGESVHLDAWFTDNVSYTWNPDETLDIYNIPDPWAFTLDDNTYIVNIIDIQTGCFDINNTYSIYVKPETSLDLPTLFTPNGDLVNDQFMVQGWGVKKVIEFKVYNRWGELVYEGFDKENGWDGTFKGKDQPNDTYIYTIKVETWLGQTLEKRGYINLIR